MTEDALTLGLWELQNDKYLIAEYSPLIRAAGASSGEHRLSHRW